MFENEKDNEKKSECDIQLLHQLIVGLQGNFESTSDLARLEGAKQSPEDEANLKRISVTRTRPASGNPRNFQQKYHQTANLAGERIIDRINENGEGIGLRLHQERFWSRKKRSKRMK
jgi:hypothetical protein